MNFGSRVGQGALVILAVYCALTIDISGVLRSVVLNGRYVGDFTVFWTASRVDPAILYDLNAISQAQASLLGGFKGDRPFVNPPSFLPWIKPFGRMHFYPAFALWVLIGAGAFLCTARRFVGWKHLPLLIVAPPFVLSVAAGQTSFLVTTLAILGLLQLDKRPLLAGALLALAATVKPQAVLLAPLALIAGAHWRALVAAIATGLAVGGVCLLVQGAQLWLDWFEAVRGFTDIATRSYLMNRGATPTNLAYQMGLDGPAAEILIWSMRLLGVVLVITVFRSSPDDLSRVAALFAGSVLCVPYAMPTETIPLVIPAALWLLGKDKRWWLPGFLMISQLQLPLAVIVMAVGTLIRTEGFQSLLPALRERLGRRSAP